MDIRESYDSAATAYASHLTSELAAKPLDRHLLSRFAEAVAGKGMVADLGCGPGHIARYLHDRGVHMIGVDVSPEMIRNARQLNPEIEFRVGDMRALDLPDASLSGVVAFYAIVHFRVTELEGVFREIRRVLEPGGLALIAFHAGHEVVHVDELFGAPCRPRFQVSFAARRDRRSWRRWYVRHRRSPASTVRWCRVPESAMLSAVDDAAEAGPVVTADSSPAKEIDMSRNMDVVNTYLDGFRTNDHAKILSCLTDDISWTVFGAFRLTGREAYDKAIDGAPEFLDPPELNVVRMVEQGNVVMAELTGTAKRAAGGEMRMSMAELFVMRDGKIAERRAWVIVLEENAYR